MQNRQPSIDYATHNRNQSMSRDLPLMQSYTGTNQIKSIIEGAQSHKRVRTPSMTCLIFQMKARKRIAKGVSPSLCILSLET
jgi:hypothetical protein